jgi:hypothetical protein
MRPKWTAWIIALFFFAGGIAFWMAIPEIFIGQIWVAVSVFLALVNVVMTLRAGRAQQMMATGVRGQAQILEMTQTGTYVNNMPRVKLKLRIQAPGIMPFDDERTMTVPLIALGQLSGGTLNVYLKPDKPRDYVIDWSAAAGGPGVTLQGAQTGSVTDPATQQAVMDALRAHGVDTTTGTVDLRQLPAAREAVLEALQRGGIDVAHQVAVAHPGAPIEAQGSPTERMEKLEQLRASKLISDSEYDTYRKRILEGL